MMLLINFAFIAGVALGFVFARYKIPAWPPRVIHGISWQAASKPRPQSYDLLKKNKLMIALIYRLYITIWMQKGRRMRTGQTAATSGGQESRIDYAFYHWSLTLALLFVSTGCARGCRARPCLKPCICAGPAPPVSPHLATV